MKPPKIHALFFLTVFVLAMTTAVPLVLAEEGLLPQQGTKAAEGTGGVSTLETLGGDKIECQKTTYLLFLFLPSSPTHATADIHSSGCTLNGLFQINTPGDATGVILLSGLLLVCLVNSAALRFGLLIQSPEAGHFEVPALGALYLAKGAIIAENTSTNSGKEFKLALKGEKGDQKSVLSCELAGKKLSHTLELAKDSATKDEDASVSTSLTVKFSETVELMDT